MATNPFPTTISVAWADNATTETSYQILRSYQQNTNFIIYRTLPANTSSFQDEGLFANATYYYKVVAIGAGGSATSTQVSKTTANNPPALTAMQDVAVKFGTTVNLDIYATDLDNDPITLTVTGLPSFATLADHTDGSGNISITPALSDLGQYPLTVVARDNHSGVTTSNFMLTVTDKAAPVILPITNATLNESKTANMQIQASSDFGNSKMVWGFTGLPAFATPTINNGLCSIALAPGYTDAGIYPVTVTVADSLASSMKAFTITVGDVDPNAKVSVNMVSTTNAAAPWNNMTGLSKASLLDGSGVATTTSVQFMNGTWLTNNVGAVTGNNSGVYPDNVIRDFYYFGFNGAPNTVDVKVSGLDITRKYYFTFFASSVFTSVPDNGSTLYTINGTTVSLRAQSNQRDVAKIKSVTPNPDGTITFRMSKAAGTPVGYLNAFTYESIYNDGTAPVPPRSVAAVFAGNTVNVNMGGCSL